MSLSVCFVDRSGWDYDVAVMRNAIAPAFERRASGAAERERRLGGWLSGSTTPVR